ncbi:hypothetical protein OAO87_01705 [bacterium]|nr:hypothetical protein [bacterium]
MPPARPSTTARVDGLLRHSRLVRHLLPAAAQQPLDASLAHMALGAHLGANVGIVPRRAPRRAMAACWLLHKAMPQTAL